MSIVNSSQPLVTVIIPSYNHGEFIAESIQSIIEQDYDNIELLIIDDGSLDDSVEVIRTYVHICNERFKRFEFRFRENKGLCATLNEALQWAKGEYFSPFASDDIALPYKINYLVDKISKSNYAAVFGKMMILSQPTHINNDHSNNGNILHNFSDLIMQNNIPNAPTALIRTSEIINIGGYAEDVKLEDWYLWLSFSEKNKELFSFSKILVLYRDHPNNTTKNIKMMHESKLNVLGKFKKNPLYNNAIKNTYLLSSRALASNEIINPIIFLLKSKTINTSSILILLKIITPSILIKFKRKLLKKLIHRNS